MITFAISFFWKTALGPVRNYLITSAAGKKFDREAFLNSQQSQKTAPKVRFLHNCETF